MIIYYNRIALTGHFVSLLKSERIVSNHIISNRFLHKDRQFLAVATVFIFYCLKICYIIVVCINHYHSFVIHSVS